MSENDDLRIFSEDLVNRTLGIDLFTGIKAYELMVEIIRKLRRTLEVFDASYVSYIHSYTNTADEIIKALRKKDFMVDSNDINDKEFMQMKILPLKSHCFNYVNQFYVSKNDVNLEEALRVTAEKFNISFFIDRVNQDISKIRELLEEDNLDIVNEISVFDDRIPFFSSLLLPLVNLSSISVNIYKLIPNYRNVSIMRPFYLWLNFLNVIPKDEINTNLIVNVVLAERGSDPLFKNVLQYLYFIDNTKSLRPESSFGLSFFEEQITPERKNIIFALVEGKSLNLRNAANQFVAMRVENALRELIESFKDKIYDISKYPVSAAEVILVYPKSAGISPSIRGLLDGGIRGLIREITGGTTTYFRLEQVINEFEKTYIILRFFVPVKHFIKSIKDNLLDIEENRDDFRLMLNGLKRALNTALRGVGDIKTEIFLKKFTERLNLIEKELIGGGRVNARKDE